jgi:serine protease Do
MKYLAPLIAVTLLVAGVFLCVGPRVAADLDAQESSKDARIHSDPRAGKSTQHSFGAHGQRPFPAFCVEEVISKLTSVTEPLIQKKLVRNSDELRKNLDRTSLPLKLIPAATKELSTQELYRRVSDSVFLVAGLTKPAEKEVEWKTAFSTAFVVHEDGILSTSAHVFDHEDHDDAVVVLDFRGNVYPVLEILAADRKADTLLFRIGMKGLKPLPLGQEPAPGSPVRVMGHPGDSFFFFSAGHVANYERDEEQNYWLNVTADFGQGSSGGPVMDDAGNVIGQVSRTYTLYASGDASKRGRQPRATRQLQTTEVKEDGKNPVEENKADPKKNADPQMVFKACTPVSAIRALVK